MPSHIRKRRRKDGEFSYLVQVPLPDGRTTRKTFNNERDAKKWLGKKLDEVDNDDVFVPSKQTLGMFLDAWIKKNQRFLRENTAESYEYIITQYIKPHLGDVPLKKLKRGPIQAAFNKMGDAGLSLSTRKYIRSVLHNALASQEGMTEDRNPAKAWTKSNRKGIRLNESEGDSEDQEFRAFDIHEAREFLAIVDAADDELDERRLIAKPKNEDADGVRIAAPMSALFYVLLGTGLRPSEAFALKWSDVNFDTDDQGRGSLTVSKSLTRKKDGSWVLNPPKTRKGRRTVPVPKPTLESLKRHRGRQAEHRMRVGGFWREQGFIFTTVFGDPLEVRNTRHRHFLPALRQLAAELHPALEDGTVLPDVEAARADIMRTRLYDLRHSFGSIAIARGVNIKTVSVWMGHESIMTTLTTYTHSLDSVEQEGAAIFEDALFG